jgi:hypothetical protein
MNELISAIGGRLASLYGAGNVYFGDAEESATFPYQVYTIQGGGVDQYSACSRSASAVNNTSVQISVWSKSSITSSSRIDAIVTSFSDTNLILSTGKFFRADKVDQTVFVDPDRYQDGQRVWHGVAILEFVWSKGA